jgi:hypothetical protein
MIRRCAVALAATLLALLSLASLARADFGIVPGSVTITPENRDGTLDTQAGSHPYGLSFHFDFKTEAGGRTEGGEPRDLRLDLSPGLFGNPAALPACPRQSFEGPAPGCAPSTQVGVFKAILPGLKGEAYGALYNLVPPPGSAAQLGFSSAGLTALFSAQVDPAKGYAVHVQAPNLPLEVSSVTATIWGTPADPGHDPERGNEGGLSTDAPLLPFFTLPTSCESSPSLRVEADSKLAPGLFVGETGFMLDKGANPVALSGCEAVPFAPKILAAPTSAQAGSAAGLGVKLALPNQGLLNPKEGAVTETEPERMVLTLPQGITANPAAASGLAACTPAQFEAATDVSGPGQGCPQSSKIGTLIATTPLLEEAVEGSLYLAAPHDNPFDSLLALYIIARAPARGVLVKQAGEVSIDPLSGQLTTSFDGLPPVPYSGLEVRLREGPRAPLITPQTCGTYTTTALLYPFSDPLTATARSAPFTISSGAGGSACASSEAQLPNNPTLSAGTTIPIAGAYSPFLFKISRADGEQRFGAVGATLPGGLVAKLAGIPYCPDAAIAAAAARSGEGEGAVELAQPSCPAASQVGTVLAGAGAGPTPYYVTGNAYLAGPYKGAPLSMVTITPAIAGPFDLGVVVVRIGLYVDETSAVVSVKSDPLPQILHGLPLDVRSVAVRMDRQSFVINPTSCEEKAISAQVTSTTGAVAPVQNRFQVGSCRGLDFSPKLSLKLSGGTRRNKHPALKAVLTQPAGQANIAKLSFTLPSTEFVDPNHISNPCTRPQFNAGRCPPASVLGKVRAFTPLFDQPLEGPIYFRANGGERELPDAVADLNGQIHIVSVSFLDSLHHKGSEQSRIRTTIAMVPDAPLSKVVIQLNSGKEKGLLVNSQNLCKTKVSQRAIIKLTGHNGKAHNSEPLIANSCPG